MMRTGGKKRWSVIGAAAAVLLASSGVYRADPPTLIRYKARLVDAAGVSITGMHDITFTIFSAETDGTSLWSETWMGVDLGGAGTADILLGDGGTPLTSSVLTASDRWLEVTVDGSVLSPRQRLSSVPFAHVSDRLGTLTLTGVQADTDSRVGTHAAFEEAHHPAVTLDAAYDQGGAGIGRTITADSGPVLIEGPDGLDVSTGWVELLGPNASRNIFLAAVDGSNDGWLGLYNVSGNLFQSQGPTGSDSGNVTVFSPVGTPNTVMSSTGGGVRGFLAVHDSGATRGIFAVDTFGAASLDLNGPNNLNNVLLSSTDSGLTGFIGTYDASGNLIALVSGVSSGGGNVTTFGPNGTTNIALDTPAGQGNRGSLAVVDEFDITQAGILVDAAGNGIVFGDTKTFVKEHPTREGMRIIYISLEGPEGAIFYRGRVPLTNGRATIDLPEHFRVLVLEGSMTVNLTPHSLESKGVAVASIRPEAIDIGELQGGQGAYDVSFVVHATRADLAGHQPVVSAAQFEAAYGMSASAAAEAAATVPPADLTADPPASRPE